MGSIRTRKGARGTTYNALWRDPNGKQRSKTFTTRQAAKAFLKPRSAVPGYRPPVPQHEGTLAAYAATWIEEHDLKPAARQTYRLELAKHILPALGRLQLAHVTSADIYTTVKKWRAAGMGPTVQAKCRTIMSALFEDAVARGILPANPARRVQIARQAAREMRILTVEEYQRVIKYLDPGPRLLVRLAVASGARWGELAELRGADLAGDTLSISRNVAELKSPHRFVVQATPKNGKARKVKIPRALAAEVRAAVTDPGKLLFPAQAAGISAGTSSTTSGTGRRRRRRSARHAGCTTCGTPRSAGGWRTECHWPPCGTGRGIRRSPSPPGTSTALTTLRTRRWAGQWPKPSNTSSSSSNGPSSSRQTRNRFPSATHSAVQCQAGLLMVADNDRRVPALEFLASDHVVAHCAEPSQLIHGRSPPGYGVRQAYSYSCMLLYTGTCLICVFPAQAS